MSEQKVKLRKKLYKSGKHWVVAGIAFFGMTTGLTTIASADGDVAPAVTTMQIRRKRSRRLVRYRLLRWQRSAKMSIRMWWLVVKATVWPHRLVS